MKRDDAIKQVEAGIAQLHQALGQGRSEQLEQYLKVMSRFHQYSFGNVMMILAQRPDSTHVAGFNRWRQLGRHVKKGEKGIAILAPCKYKRKVEDEKTGDKSEVQVLRGFKVVYVFDISSTDGNDLPEFAAVTGEPGENLLLVEQFIRQQGIELEYGPLPPGVLGSSAGGKITIRPELSAAETFCVAVHEVAHERLHHGERRHETDKKIRETEAEAVAFVVANAFGLDCVTRSSDYIQLYRGTPETLGESLHYVQTTAAWIIDGISGVELCESRMNGHGKRHQEQEAA